MGSLVLIRKNGRSSIRGRMTGIPNSPRSPFLALITEGIYVGKPDDIKVPNDSGKMVTPATSSDQVTSFIMDQVHGSCENMIIEGDVMTLTGVTIQLYVNPGDIEYVPF